MTITRTIPTVLAALLSVLVIARLAHGHEAKVVCCGGGAEPMCCTSEFGSPPPGTCCCIEGWSPAALHAAIDKAGEMNPRADLACCPCVERTPELPRFCPLPAPLLGQKISAPALVSPPRWDWSGVITLRSISFTPRTQGVGDLGDGALTHDRLCSWQV